MQACKIIGHVPLLLQIYQQGVDPCFFPSKCVLLELLISLLTFPPFCLGEFSLINVYLSKNKKKKVCCVCVCFNINLWSNTVTKKINLTPAVPKSFWVLFQALAAPLLISFPATTWERGGRWSQVLGNSATMWETQKILAPYFRLDEPRHLLIWGVNQGLTHLYITLLQKCIYLGGQSYRQKKKKKL